MNYKLGIHPRDLIVTVMACAASWLLFGNMGLGIALFIMVLVLIS